MVPLTSVRIEIVSRGRNRKCIAEKSVKWPWNVTGLCPLGPFCGAFFVSASGSYGGGAHEPAYLIRLSGTDCESTTNGPVFRSLCRCVIVWPFFWPSDIAFDIEFNMLVCTSLGDSNADCLVRRRGELAWLLCVTSFPVLCRGSTKKIVEFYNKMNLVEKIFRNAVKYLWFLEWTLLLQVTYVVDG